MSAHFDDACYGYWRCDNCGRALSVHTTTTAPVLPDPWRIVHTEGYIGDFHACRDRCETELRAHLKKQLRMTT
jgi:hypothetical protein